MSHTNFLGIPVEGDIVRGNKRQDQRPIEELQPLLAAVLADDFIVEFGWRQYTPYFNDGEPCEFSVYGPWFRTSAAADLDVEEMYQLELDSGHPTLSDRSWNHAANRYDTRVLTPEVAASAGRAKALSIAIEGGKFEDVLLEAFGDHATVTVKRGGISVEFYEHD